MQDTMESSVMKRPFHYPGDFVKPKRRRKNESKELPQDIRYAEIDSCSEVGLELPDTSYNKLDGAESIIGLYGGITPLKPKGDEEENMEDSEEEEEEEYDGKELYTEEDDDEYEDDDNDSVAALKKEIRQQDKENNLSSSLDTQNESLIEIIQFDKDNIIIRDNRSYIAYQNHIKRIIEANAKAQAMFVENKINSEYTINKMLRLKKKTAKAKQLRDEFLRIGERKLKNKFVNGEYKKIDGIVGNLYTEVYHPVEREPDLIEDAQHNDDDLALSDDHMELTLEVLEADSTQGMASDVDFSDMDLDNAGTDDESEPAEVAAEAPSVPVEPEVADILEPTRDASMELTNLEIPHRPRDDDEESTASDLDFLVSDEVKELQKLYKVPNDILRMLNEGDETKLIELLEAIQKEEEEQQEQVDEGDVEEEDNGDDDNNNDSSQQRKEEMKDTQYEDSLGEFDEDDEYFMMQVNKPFQPLDTGGIEQYADENKENESSEDINKVPSRASSVLHDPGDVSVGAPGIFHNSPIVGLDPLPPPGSPALLPAGDAHWNKIVLGCMAIPKDQLKYVKIVMVPTADIIEAYQKADSELAKLMQAPDGSSEDILARLMSQGQDTGDRSWARLMPSPDAMP